MNTDASSALKGHHGTDNSGRTGSRSNGEPIQPRPILHVHPRHHRMYVDPEVEWLEPNVTTAHLDWKLPTDQTALVLVDVWNEFYLKDTHQRADAIVRERLAPLVNEARHRGIQIIHAPSDRIANQYPQWVGKRMNFPSAQPMPFDDWPPPAFKQRTGPYAQYARPAEPRAAEITAMRERRAIHPSVMPRDSDVVVANGHELHQYCKESGLLFLFYAGIFINACMIVRDYAPLAMTRSGFTTLIVRDATTGIETAQSHQSLGQTQNFLQFFEMFTGYTVTCDEIIDGFEA